MIVRRFCLLFITLCSFGAASIARADLNVAFDNTLVSRVNGITTIQIWPACKMRLLDHSPLESGKELRIRVSTGPDCAELFGETDSERYAQDSFRLANVTDILFVALSPTNTFITIRFDEPQRFVVRQRLVGWIEVDVDTLADPASIVAAMPEPLQDAQPEAEARDIFSREPRARTRPAPIPGRASARVNPTPSSDGEFVVQLGVFADTGPAIARLREVGGEHLGFASAFVVNGRTWHGLSLGFFDSEEDAATILEQVRSDFPDAWIRYTNDLERSTALAGLDVRDVADSGVLAVAVRLTASADDATLQRLLADARRALLDRRYDDAVQQLTEVLEIPAHSRRGEARELLGVAFERSGQTANAIAEYEAYLDEFAENPNADRVTARLNGLSSIDASDVRAASANPTATRAAGDWQISGGISQLYWRNQEQLVDDGNYLVAASGVLSLADATASRRGERFDLLMRFNGAYQYNLIEFDPRGDIGWVSDAFVDIVDRRYNVQGRIGRQRNRSNGVLTRFDGASLSYRIRPDITLAASVGLPIDSPRYKSDADRSFYAASVSVDGLLDDRLDGSVFTQQQKVDGVMDRQAVGGEFRYQNGPLSVVGLLDVDLSYGVLNNALINASWLLDNGWTVSARANGGALPYLTTRNALAGQTATSIEQLLETYSEGQIRTLARDRTAQAASGTLGLSIPMGARFDASIDVTLRQADATVASGGVAALPDTGSQMFLNATLVGTNFLGANDLLILSARHNSTRTRDTQMLLVDARVPIGRGLRVSPRVVFEQHSFTSSGTEQRVITPSVRLLYRWKNILIDAEAGGRWSNRDIPATELDPFSVDGVEDLYGGFVNLSYRLEF
jgi:tetratricopeptide (TPR) repeat protein